MSICYLCFQEMDSDWGGRKIVGKITEKRGIFIKTPDFNKRLSKCKRKIIHSWLWGISQQCSESRMTLKCSQSVQLSAFQVHVHHEVLKEMRKKGWIGNHLRFSHLPDPGSLRIIKRGKIYGLYLWQKRGLCYPLQLLGIKTPMTEPLVINNRPNRSSWSLRAQFEHASGCH